jgi:hypothetical protein
MYAAVAAVNYLGFPALYHSETHVNYISAENN